MVLRGSLDLMSCKWGDERAAADNGSAVVEYLSPDKMTQLLFSKVNGTNSSETLCLDEYYHPIGEEEEMAAQRSSVPSPRSSATDIVSLLSPTSSKRKNENNSDTTNNKLTSQKFLNLLSLIQKYSVNTSHPYFFNQLFGSLDPIALAAEIVALSVNTSVYTYETAPVFTLLEREVMGQIGKLVFGQQQKKMKKNGMKKEGVEELKRVDYNNNSNDNGEEKDDTKMTEEEEFEGEGLMIPGGSLANLTAMHAARHRWKVMNGYTKQQQTQTTALDDGGQQYWSPLEENGDNIGEEKKLEDGSITSHGIRDHGEQQSGHFAPSSQQQQQQQQQQQRETLYDDNRSTPDLVAFVSSEAHYSFSKSARVLGLREDDLIVIPTHSDGRMDVMALSKRIEELEYDLEVVEEEKNQERNNYSGRSRRRQERQRVPFFVACTAGSTVRGSFDDIAEIVKVCRDYESRGGGERGISNNNSNNTTSTTNYQRSIWVHVDGAWGGSAIFSTRPSIRSITHMDEIRHADSFTFNPHKMLGAPQQTTAFIVRHRHALRDANAAGAKYLFDPRKNGAEYDLGDLSYTCGRRTDAVKLWALWKYYGRSGLGRRVDQKVDELELFVEEIRRREGPFALACKPWLFNVNFFYFPPRIRRVLEERGILLAKKGGNGESDDDDDFIQIPDDISQDLANVSVLLKLRLHEAGEMIIPYQPLNSQKADCFRLVLAGKKDFGIKDIRHILDTMEKYGADL
ncbi:hypothetical protein ACHAXR_004244 [Thalassiosira sp. AJA248-18]